MFDAKQLLTQFLGNGAGSGSAGDLLKRGENYLQSNAGGLAGGALAGGLMGLLLGTKTGRKIGKTAVTYGGAALVAGLAYKAYKNWQAGNQAGSRHAEPGASQAQSLGPAILLPPADSPFAPEQMQGGEQQLGIALLTAMIAAAKADGHIDAQEQAKIFEKLDVLQLDTEAKAFVMDELRAPLDIDKVVASAKTVEQAIEIYAASRLAIDPNHPAEAAYLQMLAARFNLAPALVDEINLAVEEAEARS